MPIINKLRKLLSLDKNTVSINNNFSDSVGLSITEGAFRKRESEPSWECLRPHTDSAHHNLIPPNDNPLDSTHHSHDFHF